MDWKNLQTMKCPSCASKIEDASMGYRCTRCEFFVGYEKFRELVSRHAKKNLYDPDKIDRSGWDI